MTNSLGAHDASAVRAALAGQTGALRRVVLGPGGRELGLPTRLGAWRERADGTGLDERLPVLS
ncbi:hypothetical protein ACFVT9_08160 [Kitasatospora cineracea]|uniref:hypothetical protein n=1 Tax=Kitasatospora cineracea TaxID=88074 RepID=UPI00367949F0